MSGTMALVCSASLLSGSLPTQEVNVQHADLHHTAMHASSKHSLTNQHQESHQEFKYTLGAARRTDLRRLKSFVKMADYMMCDTLQQVYAVMTIVFASLDHDLPKKRVVMSA